MAAAESRTTSELFRVYRAKQIRASLDEFSALAQKRGHNGYGPEDVERLVKEDRAEQAVLRERTALSR